MVGIRRKNARDLRAPEARRRALTRLGACVLLVALAAAGFAMNAVARRRLSQNREAMAQLVLNDLNLVLAAYEGIDLRSADVEGDVLPTMTRHMYAAQSLNGALTHLYGDDYGMLDARVYDDYLAATAEYARLSGMGQSPQAARAMLDACMVDLRASLGMRFDAKGNLAPVAR